MSDKRARLLHAVKTHQYLLIARSELAVPTQEMPMEQILEQILIQSRGYAAKFNFSGSSANLQPNVIYRRTKHLHSKRILTRKKIFIPDYNCGGNGSTSSLICGILCPRLG
jgi:hypothetical protein